MAYTAEQQAIIDEATRRAQANGTSPEMEVWKYAQQNNINPLQVDQFFGWNSGTTGNWAVQNGLAPAPQGNSNSVYNAQQQSVIDQAKQLAQKNGTTPEMEAWKYALQQSGGNAAKAASLADGFFGWTPGTSLAWATKNGQSANIASGGKVAPGPSPLGLNERQNVINQAKQIASTLGITPEQALYQYAKSHNLSNSDVDGYMGWDAGTTDKWAKQQNGNLGFGSTSPTTAAQPTMQSYTPNPYLGQVASGITQQMTDNLQRNVLPGIRSGAMAAGGFGGSRQGVVEANALNDFNNSLGQNLSQLYATDYNNTMNRNLNQYQSDLNYNLGLQNLDANIYNSNFNNSLNAYKTMMDGTTSGINAANNIQNTPLNYSNYFTNAYNTTAGQGGTSSQTGTGNPSLGFVGGAMAGASAYKNLKFGNAIY